MVFGSICIAEQIIFIRFHSILTFDFDCILWFVVGLFFGSDKVQRTFFRSIHIDEQLLFSMLSSYFLYLPNFGVLFGCLGSQGANIGVGDTFKNIFEVYLYT